MSTTAATQAATQAATLQRFINGWRSWTKESLFANFSDDFTQRALPYSLGQKPQTRAELCPILEPLFVFLSNFKLTVHNTVHDPAAGKAVLYAVTEADSPAGPYHNEQAVFIWFNSAGDKVERIEELFDTFFMHDFLPKFHAYRNQAAVDAVSS